MSKILTYIVDDDAFFLEMLKDNLSDNAVLDINVFQTAEDCLEKIGANPGIIILDYYLDKENPSAMNGMEALKKFHAINPSIKIIMLSGQDSLDTAGSLLDNGAYDYVIKDADAIRSLHKKINRILSSVGAN